MTPETQAAIVASIETGATARNACALAGLSYETFRRWMKAGEKPDSEEEYRAFRVAVKKAASDCKQYHIANIHRAGEKNWTASAWWLERTFPQEFGLDRDILREFKKFLRDQAKQRGSHPFGIPTEAKPVATPLNKDVDFGEGMAEVGESA